MTVEIHPLAAVDSKAQLGKNVQIGPFCVVGPNVHLGDDCKLSSHVVMSGVVRVGADNSFDPFSVIGGIPQDLSYKGEDTSVVIGSHNIFLSHVSVVRGTVKDRGVTKIGDHNMIMCHASVGHDATVQNHCIIVNSVNVGGHSLVQDRAIVGADCFIVQKLTVGRNCYLGGGSLIDRDIPPFCTAYGNRAELRGINIIGMKRAGHPRKEISELVAFYREMERASVSPRDFVSDPQVVAKYQHNKAILQFGQMIKSSLHGIPPLAHQSYEE